MTYGDFAWKDTFDASRRRAERPERRLATFVAGDPAPFMDPDEGDWAWKVRRAAGRALARPHLVFVVASMSRHGHRFGIDDLAKPVIDAVASPTLRSLWVEVTAGEPTGVRLGEGTPGFPPRIDAEAAFDVPPDRAHRRDLTAALSCFPELGGTGPVGVHLTFAPGTRLADLDFGAPIRLVLDLLGPRLGGSMGRPGDHRITDLRATLGGRSGRGFEVRAWRLLT